MYGRCDFLLCLEIAVSQQGYLLTKPVSFDHSIQYQRPKIKSLFSFFPLLSLQTTPCSFFPGTFSVCNFQRFRMFFGRAFKRCFFVQISCVFFISFPIWFLLLTIFRKSHRIPTNSKKNENICFCFLRHYGAADWPFISPIRQGKKKPPLFPSRKRG